MIRLAEDFHPIQPSRPRPKQNRKELQSAEAEQPTPERRWRMAVFALIRVHKSFLFVQKSESGWWTFPGGRVKRGESIQAALRRETLEETGLEILIGPIAAVLERSDQRQICLYFYACPKDWPTRGPKPLCPEISRIERRPLTGIPKPLSPQAEALIFHLRPPFRGAAWIPNIHSGKTAPSTTSQSTPNSP